MNLYLVTTTFPAGLLESRGLLEKVGTARSAYRSAARSYHIVSSYKIAADKTIDIVEAASKSEAEAGAKAIAVATGTSTEVVEITPYNRHLASLDKS